MEIQNKVWGERWIVRTDSTHCTSLLKLNRGYRCSWHGHKTKYNKFVVIKGKIGIVTEEIDGSKNETILKERQTFTTRPEQKHEFRVYEDSIVIEEMYVEYDEGDIQRDKLGGEIEYNKINPKVEYEVSNEK